MEITRLFEVTWSHGTTWLSPLTAHWLSQHCHCFVTSVSESNLGLSWDETRETLASNTVGFNQFQHSWNFCCCDFSELHPLHWHCTVYLWFSFWSRFCKLLANFFSETSVFAGFSFSLQEPFNKEEYLNSAFTVFKDTGQSPRSEWTTLVPVVAPVINFHVYTDQWSLSLTCADMKRSEFYCEYEYLLLQTCHPPPAIKGHKPHKSTQKNINFLSIPV